MSDNLYAPSTAHVEDVRPIAFAATPPFFAVSLLKLTVLSLCTFGVYELFWFYRNWRLIKLREEPAIGA